jgi:anti-anti-sigma factor
MLGICTAFGEIDTATAPAFYADLHDAIDTSDAVVVSVDCSDMTFIDSAGYHVLVEASEYAVRRGRSLVIRNLSPSCARVVRLCDWDHELRVEP